MGVVELPYGNDLNASMGNYPISVEMAGLTLNNLNLFLYIKWD